MELSIIGKTPIDLEHPTGSDIRYEPDFEQLQGEIDKLSSPSSVSTVDWKNVVNLASEILSKKSKDLLVASYMAIGLIHTQKIEGLAIGLQVYTDIISLFWEDLYPTKKRMRGRLSAIQWWVERSETALSQLEPAPIALEEINRIKEVLEKLDASLQEYLEEPPLLTPIQKFVNAIPPIQPVSEKPAKEPPEKEEKKEEKKISQKEPSEIPEDITSSKDAQGILNYGIQKIRQVAAYLQQEESSNPMAYRLTRIAVWSAIDSLPVAENGKTRIPPPAGQIRNILIDLNQKAEWENLLNAAEARLSRFIYWLDLNRFVAQALSNLGEQYQAAHESVCQETAFLVYRLPGLERLSFSDGMPFADEETKHWLKKIAFKGEGMQGPALTPEILLTSQDGDFMEKEIKKARDLVKKKKLSEGIAILQKHLQNSFSKRDQLLWRLALSQLLINSRQMQIAVPHLEQILNDIDEFRLEEWDPKLALKVLETVWTGFDAQTDADFRKKATDTLSRISKIDPLEALRLKG